MGKSGIKLSIVGKLKNWAKKIKTDLKALQIALVEDLVPWYVKGLILLTIGYAFSPIDLIPDFIPILGLLDDIIIVPLLIYLTIKLMSTEVLHYCRLQAETREFQKRTNWMAAGIIILLWLLVTLWLFMHFYTKW